MQEKTDRKRSVTKEHPAMWQWARNYKTSQNKDRDSCPAWAIRTVQQSSVHSKRMTWLVTWVSSLAIWTLSTWGSKPPTGRGRPAFFYLYSFLRIAKIFVFPLIRSKIKVQTVKKKRTEPWLGWRIPPCWSLAEAKDTVISVDVIFVRFGVKF